MVKGIERVKQFVTSRGLDARIVELPSSTRTSQLAAEALGCSVAEIAKSLVFTGGKSVVLVISGDKRVDIAKLRSLLGKDLQLASADEVKAVTSYTIGGVPPFPHEGEVTVYADISLGRFVRVWAAAGEPNAVMNLSVEELKRTLGTDFIDVAAS